MQLIALVLIDIKLPVFNGSESSKAMERISQGGENPEGETANKRKNRTP